MNRLKKLFETVLKIKNFTIIRWCSWATSTIIILILSGAVVSGFSVFSSLISKDLVDSAIQKNKNSLITSAIVLIGICLIKMLISSLSRLLKEKTHTRLVNRIRQDLLNSILSKKYENIKDFHSGELVNRMLSDTGIVATGIMEIIPAVTTMLIGLIGATIILLNISAKFTMFLYILGIIMVVCAVLLKKRIKVLHKMVQKEEDKVHSVLQEILENIKTIKSTDTNDYMSSQVEHRQNKLFLAKIKRRNFNVLTGSALGLAFDSCWIFTMIWGCVEIFAGAITYGTLTAITRLIGYIQSPFSGFTSVIQQFYAVAASAERLEELLCLPEEEYAFEKSIDWRKYYPNLKSIEIKDICFSYERDSILKNLNFTVQKGDFVAIIGESGKGKSTLFSLILGIYTPKSGSIIFRSSEKDIVASKYTRKMFAYVPQGNTLFSGSIEKNLTMFNSDASKEEIINACKTACIWDFISKLPDGLNTVIGERGIGISEGQAQRIAIARTLVGGSPILLLDESTSALDETTEALLLENISKLKSKTCFIVTHRKATLGICNKTVEI